MRAEQTRERRGPVLQLLAPATWLSGRLSFSRKYLLVGAVMLLALGLLSLPLLRQTHEAARRAELERRGLQAFAQHSELLAELVTLRSRAMADATADTSSSASLGEQIAALQRWSERAAPRPSELPQLSQRLLRQWTQLQELPPGEPAQPRFAAHTGGINAMLALMRENARAHRLNVDAELDAAFDVLSNRLPLLLETLAKQQDVLGLRSEAMSGYALGAQVVISENAPALRAGIAQLQQEAAVGVDLQGSLAELLARIERQQEAVDKVLGDASALQEMRQLAGANLQQALVLLRSATTVADARLQQRLTRLERSQWLVGALLVAAVAAIAYLFAGIYVSTLGSLRRLSQGTEAFCAGRLDTRIRLDSQDELVQVAGNFNTMATEVGRLLAVIHEQNESRQRELERLVQARTLELADKNDQLHMAALRVQEELASAREMQQAILPQSFPDTADFSMSACMHPARELGGDFYDCFALADGRWGFLVADVAGKGVGAAFFMAVSRTVPQDLAQTGMAPAAVLARANELLCGRNPMELFVTACYVIYDPRDGGLVYASAGHPAPLLRSATGQVQALDCDCDLALGVLPGMDYRNRQARLAAGDTLLLYTDGVTEAFAGDGQGYGDARLQAWLRQSCGEVAADKLDALVDDVAGFVGTAETSDDLTALLLCRKSGPATLAKESSTWAMPLCN
ncbi:SpoIIE family protein phosphatase [Roseateles cavernae]|uniref:SpoIIE family protein phosphatase n=1 Tax=Roseateles cavernae TaxID=3153578 RepID=UPI0032E4A02D